ncbi:MAG: bifunctional phosphopantothenoylcysteine decarboxylase/phosphopantothenate--cysteine ligase CoaBC [Candidatus Thermoplasmatota archaeon]|nr:bifunctional phosphopantothenoylcysteine decarboxylase/phosphopantothenate--cysteine ligase CoaBC [Candidatus Thermoplasmatota archaeon]MBS3790419.1 bifunctional phosphopantothenoylcysteine decarboxylase/phosphopantothenate--cysteine ligase CoaBC [Candidatus Thermoplasmatota archaeon]
MHPSEELRGSKGSDLSGKKIILGVTGSIAAVECVKLVRELIREGAEVHCVVSEWGSKIIHPNSLEFASGNETITELTGQVEHVSHCGNVPDKADLFLVAPATANTISKMAKGIDDTPVTTFATTCVGSDIPILVVPAMHQTMYDHPIIMDNLKELQEKLDVTVIGPNIEEGAAKVAEKDQIVDSVVRALNDDLEGEKITVIAGRTIEPLDSMRVVTNKASGKSGLELAKTAYRRGADVELWYGDVKVDMPNWIPSRSFETLNDLLDMASDLEGTVVVPAALSDFSPKDVKDEKISSSETLTLKLKPTPKFIDRIREDVEFLVAYKAEDCREKAVEEAEKMIEEGRADIVVANSLEDVRPEENRVYITGEDDWVEGSKRKIAEKVMDRLKEELR